jgi:large conductance mechanosensitive channel
MQGNLIEIAVGLILALVFADVITAFVENIVTPIIGAIGGEPDFGGLNFTINDSVFNYGNFLNKVITFLITGFILFLIVKAATRMFKEKKATPPTYAVEKYDEAALNARAADGWEVVSAGEAGVVLKK